MLKEADMSSRLLYTCDLSEVLPEFHVVESLVEVEQGELGQLDLFFVILKTFYFSFKRLLLLPLFLLLALTQDNLDE